jgi:hypothetical protein
VRCVQDKEMEESMKAAKIGSSVNYNKMQKRQEASQEGVRFGFRAEAGIYDFSFGYKGANEGVGIGVGFGAGLRMKIPFTSRFGFNTGFDLYMRNLFSKEVDLEIDAEYISEYTMSIPIHLQFMLTEDIPLAVGVQLDIPFGTEWVSIENNDYLSRHRASVDIGLAMELGYMVTPKAGIDFRLVVGLAGLFEDFEDPSISYEGTNKYKDKSSLRQYGFGWFYLF